MIPYRVYHYTDVSLIILPLEAKNSNIMHKLKFYYSHRYNNWVYKVPAAQMCLEYTKHILTQVETAHYEYM